MRPLYERYRDIKKKLSDGKAVSTEVMFPW